MKKDFQRAGWQRDRKRERERGRQREWKREKRKVRTIDSQNRKKGKDKM